MKAKDAPGFVLMVGLAVAFFQVLTAPLGTHLVVLIAGVLVALGLAGLVWLWARWRERRAQ
jgi:Zn-dependent protease with chaperone function